MTNWAPRRRKFISPEEDWEVAYWANRFGVSRERLVEAIQAVGYSAEMVGTYLDGDSVNHERRH